MRGTLAQLLPDGVLGETTATRLVRAGFDSASAPAMYLLLQVISAMSSPALVFAFVSRDSDLLFLASVSASIAFGLMLPPYVLLQLEQARQLRVLRSVPDCLDLLLVCVEAGVSLDAAVLRVGFEMRDMHPELARELLVINRKANAGMRRDDALHGLYNRTGVEELRTLASTMIQSERWGSSIGRVLRVYSESLRRKRRQSAERRAATAATKMMFPMVLFILPALFAVIGGPMVIGLGPVFDVFGK
jgi:tight adherence protein C